MINKRFIIAMLIIITLGLLIFYIYNFRPKNTESFDNHEIEISPTLKQTTDSISNLKTLAQTDNKLNDISVNVQDIPNEYKRKLGLTQQIRMYRFSPYGSIFDVNDITNNFTLYCLIQFNPETKSNKESILYNSSFELSKNSDSSLELNYGGKTQTITSSISYDKIYFLVISYDSSNNKLSIVFDDKLTTYESVNITINNVRIGGGDTNNNYFSGLLGYLHVFNEAKIVYDICKSEKLCNLEPVECSNHTSAESCNDSYDSNNNKCVYNNKCVPRAAIFADNPSVIDGCSKYNTDESCNQDLMCKSVSTCDDHAISQENTESDSNSIKQACTFSPETRTYNKLEECVIDCNVSGKNNKEDCNLSFCTTRCRQCPVSQCSWNTNIPNVPEAALIRCFSGMSQNNKPAVKVTWLRPESKEPIIRYTIFVEDSSGNRDINFNFSNSKADHCEYMLYELDPDTTYNIFMVSTNKFGDSPVSNVSTIKPDTSVSLSGDDISKEMYNLDHSLQQLDKGIKSGDLNYLERVVNYEDPDKDMRDVLELLSVDRINSYSNDKIQLTL